MRRSRPATATGTAAARVLGPAVGSLRGHFHDPRLAPMGLLDHAHDVVRRRLHQHVPRAARPAVRAEDHEVVRQSGQADALVGAHPILGVERGQVETVATPDRILAVVLRVGRHAEPGGQHDHVDCPLAATGGPDPGLCDGLDAVGDELDVGSVERTQIGVRDGGPLAAYLVVRGQSPPDLRVADLDPIPDVAGQPAGRAGDPAEPVVVDHEADEPCLHPARSRGPNELLNSGHAAEQTLYDPGRRPVELRAYPDRRSLVDVQARHLPGDLRHDLHRAGTGSDHRHALSAQPDRGVPCRGAHHRAAEARQPWDRRLARIDECTDRADHKSGRQLAVGKLEPPQPGLLVPCTGTDLATQPDESPHVVACPRSGRCRP